MVPILAGGRARGAAWALLVLSVLPSAAWVFIDTRVWTYDPAWYGTHALALKAALFEHPAAWPGLMLTVQGVKAPGLAWLGQFFVPLGEALGSVDLGLMVLVLLAQALTLVLVFESLERLFPGRTTGSLCGALALAASPLFVGLSHEFYAEPLQSLSVSWGLLIMSRCPGWTRRRTAVQLAGASALAMAAKVSSPLYLLGPAALIARRLLVPASEEPPEGARRAGPAWAAAGALLLTVLWYARNGASVLRFALASAYPGSSLSFWERLWFWAGAARFDLTFHPVTGLAFGTVVLCAAVRRRPRWREDAPMLACALTLAAVWLVFSASTSGCARYLLPAFVLVPVVIAWALDTLGSPGLEKALVCLLLLQLAAVHGQALGVLAPSPRNVLAYLRPAEDGAAEILDMEAVLEATCPRPGEGGPGPHVTLLGFSRLGMNDDSASYAMLKDGRFRGRGCWYWSAPAGLEATWRLIEAEGVRTVVMNDPRRYPGPEGVSYFNALTPRLLEGLRRDRRFTESRLAGTDRLLLFQASARAGGPGT